jgi:hypothetical protein
MSDFDAVQFQIFQALKKQFRVIHGMRKKVELGEDDLNEAARTAVQIMEKSGYKRPEDDGSIKAGPGVEWMRPEDKR